MATHFHQLRVKAIRRETAGCISLALEIPSQLQNEFAFIQGQNITIKTDIAGEELRRSYSICSSPLDNELRVAIKKQPGGKFSTWAHQYLQTGKLLHVLPPTGKFYTKLDAANKKQYTAFAAGSGITPILSIIKTTLLTEPGSSFTLIYGNSNRDSVIFKEELEGLKNQFISRFSIHYIFSREKTDSPLNQGRIDTAKCAAVFQHLLDIKSCDDFFLCGPAAMIFDVRDYLEKNAVEKNKIHYELFTVPGEKNNQAGNIKPVEEIVFDRKSSNVTIKSDGIAFNFILAYNGETILNAALELGADLPYACRGGVCASCRAKLLAGEVSMDNNYALEPAEVQNGYILTCQSHPRSEQVIIDFDQR